MKKLTRLVVLSLLLVAPLGCGAWSKIAPVVVSVIEAVADAVPILDSIVAWADRHFAVAPDAAAQAKLDEQVGRCRASLVEAHRRARAGDEGALESFRVEWAKLKTTIATVPGVKLAPAAAPGSLAISFSDEKTGATLFVPAPTGVEVEQ